MEKCIEHEMESGFRKGLMGIVCGGLPRVSSVP